MFKPTLAALEQFRPTFESALSYFVASNNACPEDEGFAIKGWTNVRFENHKVTTDGNRAFAMGNYFFTDTEGTEVKVEYTFGYIEDEDSNLRIQLHHSSVPAATNWAYTLVRRRLIGVYLSGGKRTLSRNMTLGLFLTIP